MHKKRIKLFVVTLLASSLILQGCGGRPTPEEVGSEVTKKQPFFVQVETTEILSDGFSLKKTGKIIGSQDIIVSADIGGRVNAINSSLGDGVEKGKTVIALSDSSGAYSFAAQRASAGLNQARINYEQTMVSLDKAISDTNLAIQQAQNQAQNTSLGIFDSGAQQQLNQLQSQLDKANIDLQTKITSDDQTIENNIASTRNLISSVKFLYQDVITTSDQLLSVSIANQNTNSQFEIYLGAKNTALKYQAESTLRPLLQKNDIIQNYNPPLNAQNLAGELRIMQGYVDELVPLLDQIERMLTFSSTGQNFSQAQLDGYSAAINALQGQVQGQSASLIQQANGIESFLRTYEQAQESIRKSITSLEQQIAGTKANLTAAAQNSGIGLESAQNNYQNTIKNKGTTEQSLLNAITQAQIAYSETQNNLGKLTVEAPIDGAIGDILVDIGQEVGPGTPLFTIASNDEQEIEIALTNDEVSRVIQGQDVIVQNNDATYNGTLVSVSRSSSQSLTYKAIVRLDETVQLLGGVATVQIPLSNENTLLPLKYVKIINSKQGSITIWSGQTIETKVIELGKVRGRNIETLTELPADTRIVTSDVSNYDPIKHTLTLQ